MREGSGEVWCGGCGEVDKNSKKCSARGATIPLRTRAKFGPKNLRHTSSLRMAPSHAQEQYHLLISEKYSEYISLKAI